MMASGFIFQRLNASGEPIGLPTIVPYKGAFIELIARVPLSIGKDRLQWFLEMAADNPGHPYDICPLRQQPGEYFCARLVFVETIQDQPLIFS